MKVSGKVVAVTGGGSGIGRALCVRFAREEPKALFVIDLNDKSAQETASLCSSDSLACEARGLDVANFSAISEFVEECEQRELGIDLFCSNAGIGVAGGIEAPFDQWERSWQVNTMAHLYAAKALIPHMVARGGGYLLNTVSAAGLLTNLGAAPYSVTKHASQALAEWLAITYYDQGIRVSSLCPQGVNTALLDATTFVDEHGLSVAKEAIVQAGPLMEPEEIAEITLQAIEAETFLILPHPEVATYFETRARQMDRWLGGMRKLQRNLEQSLKAQEQSRE